MQIPCEAGNSATGEMSTVAKLAGGAVDHVGPVCSSAEYNPLTNQPAKSSGGGGSAVDSVGSLSKAEKYNTETNTGTKISAEKAGGSQHNSARRKA